jgi:hypothetical protein
MRKQDNSGEAGSFLHTNQSANYGLILTNIVLANILAMECMIRMWWTGNLAVLRSYVKWEEYRHGGESGI